jgi:hypothetical protein
MKSKILEGQRAISIAVNRRRGVGIPWLAKKSDGLTLLCRSMHGTNNFLVIDGIERRAARLTCGQRRDPCLRKQQECPWRKALRSLRIGNAAPC